LRREQASEPAAEILSEAKDLLLLVSAQVLSAPLLMQLAR
jgi:hypothetical protein